MTEAVLSSARPRRLPTELVGGLLGVGVIAWVSWIVVRDGFKVVAAPPASQDVQTRVLWGLFLAAVFIERVVEVVMTPWRQAGASRLELDRDQAGPADRPALERALADYRIATQRIAFWLGSTLGVIMSACGVRALHWIFGSDGLTPDQATLFTLLDVVVSGTVMGGGADGIHKLVSLVTDFLDATRQRVNDYAAPAPGAIARDVTAEAPLAPTRPAATPSAVGTVAAPHVRDWGA